MAIWPLNRRKKKSELPKEVQDYYQAEKRERVGVAGLLAAATLIVTVLLAVGLFFAGRWAYRSVVNDDSSNTQTEQTGTVDDSAATQNVGTPDQAQVPAPSETDTQTETPTPTPEPTPAPTPSPSPSVSSNSNLPSTGPANIAVVVLGSVIFSGAGYYLVRRPQEQ